MARPRAGIRLRKRPDNDLWEVVGHHPATGEKIRVQCGTRDEPVAKAFLDQFLAGIASASVMAPARTPLVSDLLAKYEADRLPKVASKHTLKQNVKHLTRVVGNLELTHINSKTMASYADRRGGDDWSIPGVGVVGHGVGADTIKRELGTLRAALKWAWNGDRSGWFGTYGLPTFDMPVSSSGNSRKRWLTKEEAVRLIENAAPHIALFTMLALETAARKEAIESLTWSQIDFEHNIVDFGEGRGNKHRPIVEVTGDLMAELQTAHEARTTDMVIEFAGHSGRNRKGDGESKRGVIDTKRGLYRAAIRAKFISGHRKDKHGKLVPETDVTAHVLKHSAITWMVRAGMSYEDIAYRAQTTPEMIRKHYGHHDPKLSATAREAVGFLHMRRRA